MDDATHRAALFDKMTTLSAFYKSTRRRTTFSSHRLTKKRVGTPLFYSCAIFLCGLALLHTLSRHDTTFPHRRLFLMTDTPDDNNNDDEHLIRRHLGGQQQQHGGSSASSPNASSNITGWSSSSSSSDKDDNDDCPRKPGVGLTIFWILVVLYMFLGIAIICDELFVPALEIIADKWKLSDDVSGATLMAAGGSAPELATSLIGTFSRSEVGFGTIVGSAVFNVLFVIAMCAVFTPVHMAPLRLTWWPLFRDCTYYVLTLGCLGVWFAVTTPGSVTAWEAAVQFVLYILYVYIMAHNSSIERYVKTRLLGLPYEDDDDDASITYLPSKERVSMPEQKSNTSIRASSIGNDTNTKQSPGRAMSTCSSKKRPMAFRAGIGRLVLGQGGETFSEVTGMGVVTQISGDVDATFAQLDHEHRGFLDVKDLRLLLVELGNDEPEDADIAELRKVVDVNGDGRVDRTEFKVWYIQSEARLKAEVRRVFDMFDVNRDGYVELAEMDSVLQALSTQISKEQARQALSTFPATSSQIGVTFDEFQAWYQQTMFWARQKTEAASAAKSLLSTVLDAAARVVSCGPSFHESYPDDEEQTQGPANRPSGGSDETEDESMSPLSRFGVLLALPLNLVLALTVPDCRVPGREHQCYATFAMSICWIGAFSYTMVTGIEDIGVQFGAPQFIMGLIFLAAGTSVPDLLSSVVVAKQGKGDMAVSSSIGSNIFDVAVGLPVPWLLFAAAHRQNVDVTGSVAISISILLLMVILVIGSIAFSGWQMSLKLGGFMLILYLAYIAQEIARAHFGKC